MSSKVINQKSNLTKITALFKAGFIKRILEVIQLKGTIQWKNNPKMAGYLCPTTLLGEQFWKYYNEVQQVKANPKLYGEYFKALTKSQVLQPTTLMNLKQCSENKVFNALIKLKSAQHRRNPPHGLSTHYLSR